MERAISISSVGLRSGLRLPSFGRIEEVNKELWLLLSMFALCLLFNYMVSSQRMILSLYSLPTLLSAYVYGRRHATLTAFASVLIVVLMILQSPSYPAAPRRRPSSSNGSTWSRGAAR